jgi:hypothetical protein
MPFLHGKELTHKVVIRLVLVVEDALDHHDAVKADALAEDALELAVVNVALLRLVTKVNSNYGGLH